MAVIYPILKVPTFCWTSHTDERHTHAHTHTS